MPRHFIETIARKAALRQSSGKAASRVPAKLGSTEQELYLHSLEGELDASIRCAGHHACFKESSYVSVNSLHVASDPACSFTDGNRPTPQRAFRSSHRFAVSTSQSISGSRNRCGLRPPHAPSSLRVRHYPRFPPGPHFKHDRVHYSTSRYQHQNQSSTDQA